MLRIAVTLALMGTTSAIAQLTEPEVRALFVKLDQNNDKVIDRTEIPEAGLPAFETLLRLADTDKNGKLDATEIRELLPHIAATMSPIDRFKALDTNNDSKLSREEFSGAAATFDQLDINKDRFIDSSEAKQSLAKEQAPLRKRFALMDVNGDKKVSREEFKGQPKNFERLDKNKDGFVTEDEVKSLQDTKVEPKPTDKPFSIKRSTEF
jgi:Ca2+-binding EF-hand superfamily protein